MYKKKYVPKNTKQLKQWYSNKKYSKKPSPIEFSSFDDFSDWYNNQSKVCHYCGIEECITYEIAMNGILKSKRFPQGGKIGKGTSRGVWLEVDRENPTGNYDRNNCVLACYYCNNDKSDIFDSEQYGSFNQGTLLNRANYLRQLHLQCCGNC